MAAKKNSTARNNDEISGLASDLPDGEKIIVTDVRTIEKKSVPGGSGQSKVIDLQPEDENGFEDDGELPFSEDSLAALIASDGESIENEFCSVSIRREPDAMGDRFLNPQASRLQMPPLRNVELTAGKSTIEEMTRDIYGGGHYLFQIHYGGRLAATWKNSLADSPAALAKAKAESENRMQPSQQAAAQPQTAAVNPFDQMFDSMKKQKELKEMMFGEEMAELKRLRDSSRQTQTDNPQSELGMLLQHANSPNFDKLLDRFMPGEKTSVVRDVVDAAKEILPLGQEIGSFVGKVLGGAMTPAGETDLETMLRQPPPTTDAANNELPPPRSNFKRSKPPENPATGDAPKREKTKK